MNNISLRFPNEGLIFDESKGCLKAIIYNNNKIELDSPIWRAELKQRDRVQNYISNQMLEFHYNFVGNGLHMFWENEFFKVKVRIVHQYDKFKWNISVKNLSSEYGIYKVVFPIIGTIGTISEKGEDDYFVLPWQNGWLIKNPIHTFFSKKDSVDFCLGRSGYKYENEYPAQYSFQFAAYYSPQKYGYYFSTEDGDAYIKTIGFYNDFECSGFSYEVTNYPENMGDTDHYDMPYDFVLQFFEGDWQVAANIYRKWAVGQKWCNNRLADKILPDLLTQVDLWHINHTNYCLGTRTKEYYDTSVALKEELDCNLALHWYGWNIGEHDVNYPEYIDREKQDWIPELTKWNERFTEAGIVKIPYVNGRLWDIYSKSWEEENAQSAAIKNQKYELVEEPWKYNNLRPMCPATSKWQNKVKGFAKRFIIDNKFDGLYVDQVASFNAALCFDENHPHPLGGGKWWNEAYHSMIYELRKKAGKECILTTESCCETYIDVFDLFLILDTNMQDWGFNSIAGGENCESIPLFNMIYGDYALSYGSICRFSDDLDKFEFNFIRNLLWGILPAIEGVDMEELSSLQAQAYLDIIRKGVDFFKQNKELIIYGKLKQIPEYECKSRELLWKMGKGYYIKQYPIVMAAIWEDKNSERFCLMYNFDQYEQNVSINGIDLNVKPKKMEKIKL